MEGSNCILNHLELLSRLNLTYVGNVIVICMSCDGKVFSDKKRCYAILSDAEFAGGNII